MFKVKEEEEKLGEEEADEELVLLFLMKTLGKRRHRSEFNFLDEKKRSHTH